METDFAEQWFDAQVEAGVCPPCGQKMTRLHEKDVYHKTTPDGRIYSFHTLECPSCRRQYADTVVKLP